MNTDVLDEDGRDDAVSRRAREVFGVSYLYPFQRLAVHNILGACGLWEDEGAEAAPGDQIILLPTGAGKSLCFQLPAAILPGLTVVVYPLLSLMADQKRRLDGAGIASRVLRGGQQRREREEIRSALESGEVKLLITNPETLGAEGGAALCARAGVDHLVIDEAHCIAEWGESFRPSYLELGRIRGEIRPRTTTAFTATASPPVLEGIVRHLFGGERPHVISGNPDRPNIYYRVLPVLSKDEALAELLRSADRPAIVFCASRPGTEMTARYLRRRFNSGEVFFYHAGLEREEKKAVEEWFFASRDGVLCATCAYGMGVDKADIRTVIHRDAPGSVEAYLQESGRGGRDGKPCTAILLAGSGDGAWSAKNAKDSSRRAAMLAYAAQASCRRQYLLSLLGAECASCGEEGRGCDMCDASAVRSPREEETILGFIKKNPRRFTPAEAARILSGAVNHRPVSGAFPALRGFGSLSRWEESGVKEALETLLRQGKLRLCKNFFFRGRLRPGKRIPLAEGPIV
ncbi:MAG: RecQ family ATP-dependent DNA helicase [Spirochaetales bacterium]|nr:RecQ family ATP-dependent DNA helicase [Spirochaetales bacterium]